MKPGWVVLIAVVFAAGGYIIGFDQGVITQFNTTHGGPATTQSGALQPLTERPAPIPACYSYQTPIDRLFGRHHQRCY